MTPFKKNIANLILVDTEKAIIFFSN